MEQAKEHAIEENIDELSETDQECLDKISTRLEEWGGPNRIADDFFPEYARKYEELQLEFGEIDESLGIRSVSSYAREFISKGEMNHELTDKGKEVVRKYVDAKLVLDQEIKQENNKNILDEAKKLFSLAMDKDFFEKAYATAVLYLDQKSVKIAADKTIEQKAKELKSCKDVQKVYDISLKILNTKYCPEASRNNDILQKAIQELNTARKGKFLGLTYDCTSSAIELWGLDKNEDLYIFNEFAKKEVRELARTDKKKAVEKAEILEKVGILDLEKDEDFFSEITG